MRQHFNNDFIERVRESADIIAVISRYLTVKKAGTNYKGPCPFHNEKTPSFVISPHKQIFKCFGCGKAGNVFHFVMEMEGVGFPEAIEILARENGIPLPLPEKYYEKNEQSKDVMDALSWAKTFFQRNLASNQGKGAREYLAKRGITKESIEKFQLGFAPKSWNHFLDEAKAEGFEEEILLQAGLVSQKENRIYDRFRNRLMFPIWNTYGKVIAFGGRVIQSDEEPKYLNSPETSTFQKKKILYSFHLVREYVLQNKTICIMEGYTDVLMAHQCGFHGAVATLGTALTEEHAALIKRYSDTVILIFDGDSAGTKAASRSLEFFLRKGLQIKIAIPQNGLDPFDFVTKYGKDGLLNLLDNSQDFFDFEIQNLQKEHDIQSIPGKSAIIKNMARIISYIPDEITKKLFIDKLANMFKISRDSILRELGIKKKFIAPQLQQVESYKNTLINDQEKFVIAAIMHHPEWADKIFENYEPKYFKNPQTSSLAFFLQGYIKENKITIMDVASASGKLDVELGKELISIYYCENLGSEDKIEERLKRILKGLERQKHKAKMASLKKMLQETSVQDEEQRKKILIHAQEVCKTRLRDNN